MRSAPPLSRPARHPEVRVMVLVSHSHKFVFLKTRKTAGTSIEMLLEPFCAPPGHVPVEKTEGMVTPHGVIGHRLLDLDEDEHTWREHLPAKEIRRQIGKLTWLRYFRFTAVRNPFDRAVSYFHWLHDFEGKALPTGFDEIRDTFRRFVAAGRLKTDYAVTHLHRKLAFQDAVRYEHLGRGPRPHLRAAEPRCRPQPAAAHQGEHLAQERTGGVGLLRHPHRRHHPDRHGLGLRPLRLFDRPAGLRPAPHSRPEPGPSDRSVTMTEQSPNAQFHASSFLQGHNAQYVDQLYARYAQDPSAVDASWAAYFASLKDEEADIRAEAAGPSWARTDWPPVPNDELTAALDGQWAEDPVAAVKSKVAAKAQEKGVSLSEGQIRQAVTDSLRALMIIRAYRIRGHLAADLDPLGITKQSAHPELEPKTYGFTEADMDRPIFIDHVLGLETASMREIVAILKRTYCGTFALQYMHISDPEQAAFLKERIEGYGKEIAFTREGRKAILNKLVEAEGFEKFLHVKYTGTKRFGLDGGEALIPAMEQIIKRGGALGVKEIVIGMPHRGRLSVLANVMGKPYRAIFNEFQGGSFKPDEVEGSGDVKYHLGASSDREFDGNNVHLSLTANPSHLEAVNPVVLGKVRAKQDQVHDDHRTAVLPILLHGDAAFAGQGVVAECFGLSGLRGHKTGGTIHLVVNNQIGFTTAPHNSRSSPDSSSPSISCESTCWASSLATTEAELGSSEKLTMNKAAVSFGCCNGSTRTRTETVSPFRRTRDATTVMISLEALARCNAFLVFDFRPSNASAVNSRSGSPVGKSK